MKSVQLIDVHGNTLHKSSDLTLCNNYISILSSVVKVFEKVIYKHINEFLKFHNYTLSEKQSCFILRYSTVNQ